MPSGDSFEATGWHKLLRCLEWHDCYVGTMRMATATRDSGPAVDPGLAAKAATEWGEGVADPEWLQRYLPAVHRNESADGTR